MRLATVLESKTLINRITRIIAATRFPFVDQENWPKDRETIVNDETRRYAINTSIGVLYPNIVIAHPDGSIREIGTVETREEVNEMSVPRWRALSDAAPYGREFKKLFFYVPTGEEGRIKELVDETKNRLVGVGKGNFARNSSNQ